MKKLTSMYKRYMFHPILYKTVTRTSIVAVLMLLWQRYVSDGITCNAQLTSRLLEKYCALDEAPRQLLESAANVLHLSSRGFTRLIKVARTIADLDGGANITEQHVAEAIGYRSLDGKYWN